MASKLSSPNGLKGQIQNIAQSQSSRSLSIIRNASRATQARQDDMSRYYYHSHGEHLHCVKWRYTVLPLQVSIVNCSLKLVLSRLFCFGVNCCRYFATNIPTLRTNTVCIIRIRHYTRYFLLILITLGQLCQPS